MTTFPDIVAACDAKMQNRIHSYPCHANRASAIGDLCERKLVYERTHWQCKKPHDVGLEYVFNVGNVLEEPVLRLIADAGYEISRQQETFAYHSNGELLVSGHIDCVLTEKCLAYDPEILTNYTPNDLAEVVQKYIASAKIVYGRSFVGEVKTMSPYVWDTIETVRDFERYSWTAKYPAQLTLYMFGLEIPQGIWILINKSTGRLKQINYDLDYEFAEDILQRCERINSHVSNGTLPDFLGGNVKYCEQCPFYDVVCNPPIERISPELIVDENLIADVQEMLALEPHSARYEFLKKELKEKLEKTEKAIIGGVQYDGSRRNWKDRFAVIS